MFWKTLGRIIWVPIAFVISGALSLFVLVTLSLERITHAAQASTDEMAMAGILMEFVADGITLASGATLIPAIGAVIIAEVARIRSWVYYIIAGGAALAAIPLLARLGQSSDTATTSVILWQVFATAGFAGGLLYWLLAGRNA